MVDKGVINRGLGYLYVSCFYMLHYCNPCGPVPFALKDTPACMPDIRGVPVCVLDVFFLEAEKPESCNHKL